MKDRKYLYESYLNYDEVTIGRIYTIRHSSYSHDVNRVIKHSPRKNYTQRIIDGITLLDIKTFDECFEFIKKELEK